MAKKEPQSAEEAEFRDAIEAVLSSPSKKKLVIAGPGTGTAIKSSAIFKAQDALSTRDATPKASSIGKRVSRF